MTIGAFAATHYCGITSLRSRTRGASRSSQSRRVTANRTQRGHDPLLCGLADSGFDEIWLFAADRWLRAEWGGLRGHHRLPAARGRHPRDARPPGCRVVDLLARRGRRGPLFSHTQPGPGRLAPLRGRQGNRNHFVANYHSGRNGDYQRIIRVEPVHDLLRRPDSPAELIEFFSAHPHEGGVGAPEGETGARVIAMGKSRMTNRPFNLIVAFEEGEGREGRFCLASPIRSTSRRRAADAFDLHHRFNWRANAGRPSFVKTPIRATRSEGNPRARAGITTS